MVKYAFGGKVYTTGISIALVIHSLDSLESGAIVLPVF